MTIVVNTPGGDQLTFPDDTDMNLVQALVQNHVATNGPDKYLGGTLNVAGMDTGIPLPPSLEAGIVGAGKTTNDLVAGVKQAFNWATGNKTANDQLAEQQAAGAQAYAPLQQAHPAATFVGEAAPLVAAMGVPGLAGGGALGAAATGAAPGLISYGTPVQRGLQGALGAAGNVAGYGLGKFVGNIAGAGSQEAADAVANPWEIPLRAAQVTDSGPVKIADAVLQNLPGSSGPLRQAQNATFSAWNKAVSNTFGADSTQLTPGIIGAAKDAAGNNLGTIAARHTLPFTPDLNAALDAVRQRAATELPAPDASMVGSQIDNILGKFGSDNTMSGTEWKGINSSLGNTASSAQFGPTRSVVGDLRAKLQDAMFNSISNVAPQDVPAFQQNAKYYYNALQVGDATKATPGVLSPSKLLTQVNAYQPNARFGAGNDLAQVAQWGQQILPKGVPDSGTAQRALFQKILTNPLVSLGEAGATGYGVHEMGGDAKDMAVTGAIGYPLLAALGHGAASPAFASFMARAPISQMAQRLLQSSGQGLLGAPTAAWAANLPRQ